MSQGSAMGIIGGVVLAPVLVVVLMVSMLGGTSSAGACGVPGVGADASKVSGSVAGYGPEQLSVAAAIVNAGKKSGVSVKGQLVGVMVGMGESSLKNINYGDDIHGVTNPDGSLTCSLGVFQQQWCLPGEPWGSKADVTDPAKAAETFFKALTRLKDWESLDPDEAGHRVQGNYSRAGYTKFIGPAQQVFDAITSGTAGSDAKAPACAGTVGDPGKDDDYPYKNSEYNAINPVTGFAYRNCTDFAWHRVLQQAGITDQARMKPSRLWPGNANTWGPAWQKAGWTVTMTPKVGAIIWYGPGNPGGSPEYGHVAVVKAIQADGKVLEEGYNMAPDNLGSYYTRTIAADSPSGYLLIPTTDQYVQAA